MVINILIWFFSWISTLSIGLWVLSGYNYFYKQKDISIVCYLMFCTLVSLILLKYTLKFRNKTLQTRLGVKILQLFVFLGTLYSAGIYIADLLFI